ncbi:MAG: endonuclease domain-containing protein [Candidatus Neomarinimicrobiota bacterium]
MKFLRQHPIGSSVVDFYCHEKRLAIEIDGGIHRSMDIKKRDQYRQKLIEGYGIRFFRCQADEVESDLAKVIERLKHYIEELDSTDE